MGSLPDLPFLEALYETRVGFDAGPVLLDKGKRELVRHAVVFDEIGDDNGSAARDALGGEGEGEGEGEEGEMYLLAVDEDVLSSHERLFDTRAGVVEVGL